MAINTSSVKFRALSRKIGGPTFRTGIGEVYRELERQGKIPAEGIEQVAAFEAQKKAEAEARTKRKSTVQRIKRVGNWIAEQLD